MEKFITARGIDLGEKGGTSDNVTVGLSCPGIRLFKMMAKNIGDEFSWKNLRKIARRDVITIHLLWSLGITAVKALGGLRVFLGERVLMGGGVGEEKRERKSEV